MADFTCVATEDHVSISFSSESRVSVSVRCDSSGPVFSAAGQVHIQLDYLPALQTAFHR